MTTARLSLIFALPAVVAVAGLFAGCEKESAAGPDKRTAKAPEGPPFVRVLPVQSLTLADRIRFSGTVAPNRQTMISPKVPGTIVAIHGHAGDPIRKGQVLVELDKADFELQVRQARSAIAVARAGTGQARTARTSAKVQWDRFKRLKAKKSIAAAQFDEVDAGYKQAKAAVRTGQAQLAAARIGLEAAERQLGYTTITAPFDGYIVKRLVDEGEVARAMPPTIVMVVVEAPPLFVVGAVGERDAARLEEGTTLRVNAGAAPGQEIRAKVTQVNAMVDPETRSVSVRALVLRGAEHLRVGMSAEVFAELGERRVLAVPLLGLMNRVGDRGEIWVITDGKASLRKLQLGAVRGDLILVDSGVRAGEQVVVAGQPDLSEGGAARIKTDSRKPAAGGAR